MQQIFHSVQYMHTSGVVHRDLKLQNFMLYHDSPIANNVVKLVDFGFARAWQPGQVLTTKVGTPYYVAPQVLEGSYDNKSDTWSCGVVMFILLMGYPPFTADTNQELFRAIRRQSLNFSNHSWKGVSANAPDLIAHLLAYDQHCRYDAKQALEHNWLESQLAGAEHAKLQTNVDSQSVHITEEK